MTEEQIEQVHTKMEEVKQANAFYKHLHLATLDLEPAAIFTADEVRQLIANEYNRFSKG
jgi:catechol-2,3-dioxygenase|tara:strand:- start:869 stop:1045 length:177 start_codon:yes stop_codon:yes gene_type:complete